jgi:hypothetical protein
LSNTGTSTYVFLDIVRFISEMAFLVAKKEKNPINRNKFFFLPIG